MPKKFIIPITVRAVTQRINRVLREKHQRLTFVRVRGRGRGKYGVKDTKRNVLLQVNVDLQNLGRKLKVVEPWEIVDKER